MNINKGHTFVWGATYTNKGSEAMMYALHKALNQRIIFAADYDSDLEVKTNNIDGVFAPKGILKYFNFVFLAMIYKLFSISNREYTDMFRAISSAERVVDLSGFALSEDFSKNSCTYRSLVYLSQVFVSKVIFRKRYSIFPQAIGPIERPINKLIVKLIFKLADDRYIRGKRSYEFSKTVTKSKLHLTSDLALLLNEKDYVNSTSKFKEIKYILINPNSRIYHKELKQGKSYYFKKLSDLVIEIKKLGFSVVLTPNEIRNFEFDDLDLCQEIKTQFINDDSVIVNDDVSLEMLFTLANYSQMNVLSRFHLMIFSLMCRKPLVVLSWSEKYLDIMETFSLQDYCITHESDVFGTVELALKNEHEISNLINSNLSKARASVEELV